MNRNQEYVEHVETVEQAVHKATFADDHGNGTGCTKSFVVRRDGLRVSVVRKHTFSQGSYYLFTVETETQPPKWLTDEIEAVFDMTDTDVTVGFTEHNHEQTCIVPTTFYHG